MTAKLILHGKKTLMNVQAWGFDQEMYVQPAVVIMDIELRIVRPTMCWILLVYWACPVIGNLSALTF